MTTLVSRIVEELHLKPFQVENTLQLFTDGATIPFIARYRKERTGELDEVVIENIQTLHQKLTELEKRKTAIIKSIDEQEKLTDELKQRIINCFSSTELEDIYLPYKPKRRTKAEMAREKGLEPLAKILMAQNETNPENRAKQFLNKEVASTEDALQGARDIIAEWVSEKERARNIVRHTYEKTATISSKVIKGKEEAAIKYRDYFENSMQLSRISSHRLLAMRRGEAEELLKVSIDADSDQVLYHMERYFLKNNSAASEEVKKAITDSYKRLLKPAITTEMASTSKDKADDEAIRVFATNLRQLLLAPPLGQKRVMAIDPGFRTGCKVVCLDAEGNLLHNETIFPHPPQNEKKQSYRKITSLISQYSIEAVAIGNGTAGRETEQLFQHMHLPENLQVFVINESGASVYSASKIGREEFPQYDVTVRGSVSIGRRLMDPLAELVKIDPKSIGVGQYQHDVNQPKLKSSLDNVVESCVNSVGININTASRHLLTYISGLGPTLAENIVNYRKENGAFNNRTELLNVPRMGQKAYEQAAGFLRISSGNDPLDNTGIHPEAYALVKRMAKSIKCKVSELIANADMISKIEPEKFTSEQFGLPTINDILKELAKPGRDPREKIRVFTFSNEINSIEDLKVGHILPGLVNNITKFGAFVDLGIKENGLIHISELADGFISDPLTVVQLHQQLRVRVISVDLKQKRIALSLKQAKPGSNQ